VGPGCNPNMHKVQTGGNFDVEKTEPTVGEEWGNATTRSKRNDHFTGERMKGPRPETASSGDRETPHLPPVFECLVARKGEKENKWGGVQYVRG